jgi:hypothetical protein
MLRIRRFSGAFLLFPLVTTTCAHFGPHAGTARLRIQCCIPKEVLVDGQWSEKCGLSLELAKVLIDGKEAGDCDEWGGDGRYVSAGSHHIQVQDMEHQRCFDYSDDIELRPGGKVTVNAMLAPMPD